ncbi:hypothetical protein [Janthinobacterium sp. PC23-8]|uniref:hypothetical protein n=1 Tax=Janthinobacterium sp. PC23-8 TaxID=2012679 RepID=UPI0011401A02|nr:hypothetical protein [Janthinobacterium sp. PC23-8]
MILIILLCWCASGAAAHDGSVTLAGDGALIRYRGMLLALDGAVAEQTVDLRLSSGSLPLWQSISWRKGRQRVRITALPGPGDTPALLLDFGDNGYRIVIPGAGMAREDYPLLAQRYPGADLALPLENGQRVILHGEQLQTSPYRFSNIRR